MFISDRDLYEYSAASDDLLDRVNPMLHFALDYAAIGLAVAPGDPGLGSEGTCDPISIVRFCMAATELRLHIVTGRPSGVVALTLDPALGGEATMRGIGRIPSSLTILYPDGRRSIVLAWPPSAGPMPPTSALGAGLWLEGEGGHVLAPPSVSDGGKLCRWRRYPSRRSQIADVRPALVEALPSRLAER